jgi:hypothetical protein
MIFITTYKTKPYMTKEETSELMALFAEVGNAPGTTAHYVAADASSGVVISEVDDITETYRNLLNYEPYIEFESKVMLRVEDAVPLLTDFLS